MFSHGSSLGLGDSAFLEVQFSTLINREWTTGPLKIVTKNGNIRFFLEGIFRTVRSLKIFVVVVVVVVVVVALFSIPSKKADIDTSQDFCEIMRIIT